MPQPLAYPPRFPGRRANNLLADARVLSAGRSGTVEMLPGDLLSSHRIPGTGMVLRRTAGSRICSMVPGRDTGNEWFEPVDEEEYNSWPDDISQPSIKNRPDRITDPALSSLTAERYQDTQIHRYSGYCYDGTVCLLLKASERRIYCRYAAEEIQLVAVAFPGFLIADIAFKKRVPGDVCLSRTNGIREGYAKTLKPDTAVMDKSWFAVCINSGGKPSVMVLSPEHICFILKTSGVK